MSETPSPSPTTPSKEDETKKVVPTTNEATIKKYEGDGLPFKGKLIGMEDLSIDRDEKVCLDSMFKLKAVVKARGEHKQRVQLNLTMSAVKVIDDATKAQIASHEIERISFVVIDPRDTRAFGYIYNTSDDRHQFWAIKTERNAAGTVLALKELFELAFEQYTKAEIVKTEIAKTPSPPPPTSPVSPSEVTVPKEEAPVVAPAPVSSSPPPPPPPPQPPTPSEPVVQTTTSSPFGEDPWKDSPSTTVPQPTQPTQENSLLDWDAEEPIAPVIKPAPQEEDPLADLLFTTLSTTTQQPSSTGADNPLFDLFSNPNPVTVPPPSNSYGNPLPQQTTSPFLFRGAPIVPEQQQMVLPTSLPPVQQQQQQQQYQPDYLGSTGPLSPVAPPTVTSPFAGFDFLGGITSTTAAKTTKESFFPAAPPQKTVQQLLQEKQP